VSAAGTPTPTPDDSSEREAAHSAMTDAIPPGFGSLTPHVTIKGCQDALALYARAFGAEEVDVHRTPDGGILHASMRIGDSMLMMNEEYPDQGVLGPDPARRSPVVLHLYVEDVDGWHERATQAGCESLFPPTDMFWGDRYAMVKDPYGHVWSIAKHVEDVSPEDMRKRMAEAFS